MTTAVEPFSDKLALSLCFVLSDNVAFINLRECTHMCECECVCVCEHMCVSVIFCLLFCQKKVEKQTKICWFTKKPWQVDVRIPSSKEAFGSK